VIEAASGGGLQVSATSGAATSPDEQVDSWEGWVVAVGLGVGDGLAGTIPHAHNASRMIRCKRLEICRFMGTSNRKLINPKQAWTSPFDSSIAWSFEHAEISIAPHTFIQTVNEHIGI